MCVGVVGLEDVEEAMDVCLSCCCFDFLFLFLVDTESFQVSIHGVFVYGFGAYYKVQLVRCPSCFFGLSKDFHKDLILFGCHFIFSF